MSKKVTTCEIKGLLTYFCQADADTWPENPEPKGRYCVMKESTLNVRSEDTQQVLLTVEVEGANITLPDPAHSVGAGFYGVCVQCVGSPQIHHFLWRSATVREEKYAVLLRAAKAGNWPTCKIYDPEREGELFIVGARSFFDVPIHEKKLLLLQKLQLCSVRFDMTDEFSHQHAKAVKASVLKELVSVSHHMPELNDCRSFKDILRMIGNNLFRSFPSISGDPVPADTEDEDIPDPAWEHLQLVYELLHKVFNAAHIDDAVRKKSTTVSFLSKMISLFSSRDSRERECLKQSTHRIYGRLTNRRAAIRKIFKHIFAGELYEPSPSYRGIAEMLDILASIINGFATPIKQEHKQMLRHYLIPLHKLPDAHAYYHQQLHYCMILFASKDHEFTVDIIRGILKYWPIGNNPKEQQFLQELEDLFEYVTIADFAKFHEAFKQRFVQLLEAPHFQTTERALWFWRNPSFNELAVKHKQFGTSLLEAVFEALHTNTLEHWHDSVRTMSEEILKLYKLEFPNTFQKCVSAYNMQREVPGGDDESGRPPIPPPLVD